MKKTSKAAPARAGKRHAAQANVSIELSPVALSVAIALGAPGYAYAQDAAAPASAAPAEQKADVDQALDLGTIVVTAASAQKSKLESSLSVTDVSSQLVEAMNPQSQAEILRLIPGMIVGDTAGPGGNANISVRGLPITTGGSPFVQLQEDGLPTVLFGDMNFGNNDYWTRFDTSNTIEAVRGGSASTLASGAPGAVINYISATGTEKGGIFTLSNGIGYNLHRATFAVGGPLASDWRFHADGFFEQGRGRRDQGFDAQQGYQLKANVTHDLEGNKGYLRFYVKLLDDQSPTYTSMPVRVNAGGNSLSGISSYPGFDSRTGSTIGVYNQTFSVLDNASGTLSQVPASGIHPVAHALGTELHYKLDGDLTVDDKFRYTQMSGSFATQFGGYTTAASVIGSTVNGQTVGAIKYADGPLAGKTFAGQYLINNAQIYTHMNDMGNTVNDLSFNDKWHLTANSQLSAKGGLFYMSQNIAQDWHPDDAYQELAGSNPSMLNLYSTAGQLLTNNGVSGYNTNWGTCCGRQYDMKVADTAPYIDLTWDQGSLQLEGSVRQDFLNVTGWAESASAATTKQTTINGALVSTSTLDPSTYEALNYGFNYRSYSLGALYLINDDTSAFVRVSRGGKANTDRNILSGYTNPDGTLNSSGAQKAFDIVYQQEIGIKTRGYIGRGAYGLEATIFHDSFSVSNFDLTQCNAAHVCGEYFQTAYSAKGLELEGSYKQGGFALVGQLTYTSANTDLNATSYGTAALTSAGTGFPPPNTPALSYMLSPTYSWGPGIGGLVLQGQGRSNINGNAAYYAPGQQFVDAFVDYDIAKNVTLGLHVNNLFNSLGINGHSDQTPAAAGATIITAPGALGRTTDLSLSIKF